MAQPLAERLRPKTLDDYIGQKHLVGPGAVSYTHLDVYKRQKEPYLSRVRSYILRL